MALHPHFPADPYAPLLPDERWFPAAAVPIGTDRAELDAMRYDLPADLGEIP